MGERTWGHGSMWQRATPCTSDHRTLEKRVRAGIRVPLFHTPSGCLDPDIFQVHREDLPAGLKLCAHAHNLHLSQVPGYNFNLL